MISKSIPWLTEAKYLEFRVNAKLTWNNHTNTFKQRGFLAISQLYSQLELNPLICPVNYYSSVIHSILTYVFLVWESAAPTHMKKKQVIQNKIIRFIVWRYIICR